MAIVKKLLHTRYRVDDLESSVKFYTEILGLTETRRHKSPRGSELVFLATPNSDEEIELCSYPSSGGVQVQEDLTHLAFERWRAWWNLKNTSNHWAWNTPMART